MGEKEKKERKDKGASPKKEKKEKKDKSPKAKKEEKEKKAKKDKRGGDSRAEDALSAPHSSAAAVSEAVPQSHASHATGHSVVSQVEDCQSAPPPAVHDASRTPQLVHSSASVRLDRTPSVVSLHPAHSTASDHLFHEPPVPVPPAPVPVPPAPLAAAFRDRATSMGDRSATWFGDGFVEASPQHQHPAAAEPPLHQYQHPAAAEPPPSHQHRLPSEAQHPTSLPPRGSPAPLGEHGYAGPPRGMTVGVPPGRPPVVGGLGLPTVQEALLETLRQERAGREETEARLAEAHRCIDELQRDLEEVRAREDREAQLHEEVTHHRHYVERACADKDAVLEENSHLRDGAARATERAIERSKQADDLEEGMRLQILALRERLVSSQTAAARDRAELLKTVRAMSADGNEKDSHILALRREIAGLQNAQEEQARENAEALAANSDPYRQLNNVLMASLAAVKSENEGFKIRCATLDSENAALRAEVQRLKDAQEILRGPYRTRRGTDRDRFGSGLQAVTQSLSTSMLSHDDAAFDATPESALLAIAAPTPPPSGVCAPPPGVAGLTTSKFVTPQRHRSPAAAPRLQPEDHQALLLQEVEALRSGWNATRDHAEAPLADAAVDDLQEPETGSNVLDGEHDAPAPTPTAPSTAREPSHPSTTPRGYRVPSQSAATHSTVHLRSASPQRLDQPRQSSPVGGALSSLGGAVPAYPRHAQGAPVNSVVYPPADEFTELSPGPLSPGPLNPGPLPPQDPPPAPPPPPPSHPAPGTREHAEALDALKSSLADVRGLLQRRAQRRRSASPLREGHRGPA